MHELDEAIEKWEGKLRQRLTALADRDSLAMLDNIETIRKTKQLILDASLVQFTKAPLERNGASASDATRGDAAAEIIQKAGKPVHVSVLMQKLEGYGFKGVKRANLVSILIKDRRKRFINTGQSNFDLNPNARTNGAGVEKKPLALPLIDQEFSLTDSMKRFVSQAQGEFSQPLIYKSLIKQYPGEAKRIQKPTISTILTKFVKRGLIEVTHQGFGSDPRRYKRKEVN